MIDPITKGFSWQQKLKARVAVQNALRDGRLVRPANCQDCGRKPLRRRSLSGHHEDYRKPLKVMWLCDKCHRIRHAPPRPTNVVAFTVYVPDDVRHAIKIEAHINSETPGKMIGRILSECFVLRESKERLTALSRGELTLRLAKGAEA